ncbi:hypothetical protein [Micromonospora sp. WMMD1082]|uniref:hypothetical protein n=1 Tax=Micromonospora sp. WMMD1082 TaxID=3016104 RepID=UPI002415ACDA|nr:hypothetical protein [Micromonospora sp. WMMD1082]MDG4797960.1 hypothetical protein [Micromonospora sp. WMMD1082]
MLVGRWLAGAGLVALVATMGACGVATASEGDGAPAGVGPSGTVPAASAPASGNPAASAPASGSAVESAPPTASSALSAVLSGTRRVTIVRVDGFESGLSLLDGGRLAEVDDDQGRQVFVPTPLGSQEFLIKSYRGGGAGRPLCWQVHNPGDGRPLVVHGAACRAGDPRQRFVIVPVPTGGDREFLIMNRWAYLRTSARSGLILEELGDSPPMNSFRFNDTGPAPRQG